MIISKFKGIELEKSKIEKLRESIKNNSILIIATIIFLFAIGAVFFFASSDSNKGSYLIAVTSIYIMFITNFINNKHNNKQIEQTRKMMSIELRKDEIEDALSQFVADLEHIINSKNEEKYLTYNLCKILSKNYLKYLPYFIYRLYYENIRELIAKNDEREMFKLEEDFEFVKLKINDNLENFQKRYENLDSETEYGVAFKGIFDHILNSSLESLENNRAKLMVFLTVLSIAIKTTPIDTILKVEFLDD